jgi:hypothetical protein
MHVQLKAWEEQKEESWKEIGVLKDKLLKAVQMMRETKGSLPQMECHAAALEQAVRATFTKIKGEKEKEPLVVKVAVAEEKKRKGQSAWRRNCRQRKKKGSSRHKENKRGDGDGRSRSIIGSCTQTYCRCRQAGHRALQRAQRRHIFSGKQFGIPAPGLT